MVTTYNNTEKKIIVAFHVARGGQHFNPGHKTYLPNVKCLLDYLPYSPEDVIVKEDAQGNPFPEEKWVWCDGNGEVLLWGRAAIEAETGILDYDGEYDTCIVRYLEDCTEDEISVLFQAYLAGEVTDEDIANYVCESEGYRRIVRVKNNDKETIILLSDHSELILSEDMLEDDSAESIREWLIDENVDEKSAKYWADQLEYNI
ncbi:MAG: hypothetical protein SPF56_07240 [Bacteroidaceae bacterium]|nr:hypothetical protein [Prevotellaceae bacterium]MDY5632263.1 hypothetical protein [Bacteroidaceae bacterium]